MRPFNDDRVVVEYARINRIAIPNVTDQEPSSFQEDVIARLRTGEDLSGRWWGREWRLGDLDVRAGANQAPTSLSAKFGWFAEIETLDVPPPYDEATHTWNDEPARVREGALALFVLDFDSQLLAITSSAGDVALPGFCHALTDLLHRAEMSAAQDAPGRAERLWSVEPVAIAGSFEAWVERMSRVTRVRANFHLPNPRTSDDIEPVVSLLNDIDARSASIEVKSENGLDPWGHPVLQAAISMHEHDFGTVTADGFDESGLPDRYASRDHPVHDVRPDGPRGPAPLGSGGSRADARSSGGEHSERDALMPLQTKDLGFWRSIGSLSLAQTFGSWDFITAVVLAGSGDWWYVRHVPDPAKQAAFASNLLVVNGALFGVVLAGFAITAALVSERYSRLVETAGGSRLQMLRHFLIVAGLLVSSIVLTLGFIASASSIYTSSRVGEQVFFGAATFVFLWSLFSTLELVKLVLGIAATNSELHRVPEAEERDRRAK